MEVTLPDEERRIHIIFANPGSNTRAARRKARSHSAREAHAQARVRRAALKKRNEARSGQTKEDAEDTVTVRVCREAAPLQSCKVPPRSGERGVAAADSMSVTLEAASWLASLATASAPLTRTDRFLLHYYIAVVISDMQRHCLNLDEAPSNQQRLLVDFARLSHADTGFLNGLLLQACRHMCRHRSHQNQFQQMATSYKLKSLRSLNSAIVVAPSTVTDSTIANVLVLALDEMVLGDLRMTRNHVLGAVKMVNLNGGPQTLGLDGFLWYLIQNFVQNKGLFDDARIE